MLPTTDMRETSDYPRVVTEIPPPSRLTAITEMDDGRGGKAWRLTILSHELYVEERIPGEKREGKPKDDLDLLIADLKWFNVLEKRMVIIECFSLRDVPEIVANAIRSFKSLFAIRGVPLVICAKPDSNFEARFEKAKGIPAERVIKCFINVHDAIKHFGPQVSSAA